MKQVACGVAFLLSLTLLVAPGSAGVAPCPLGCRRLTKACRQSARVSRRSCVSSCGGSANVASCRTSCLTTLRAAMSSCGTDQGSCVGLCPPPTPPSSCQGAQLDTCGQDLATCAIGVIADVKACVRGCSGATRGACFQTCATVAAAGVEQCRSAFPTCIGPCRPSTTTSTLPNTCGSDADCADGNPCTVDRCTSGQCEHSCVCLDASATQTCCPGPAALCVRPTTTTTPTDVCGATPFGTCGGACPASSACRRGPTAAASCGCVSGIGGPCGGNILAPPPVCDAGLVCQHANPDVTGVCVLPTQPCGDTSPLCNGSCPAGSACTSLTGALACQCVPEVCAPGEGKFFFTCGDPVCGGPRPRPGVPACTTQQAGAACSCLGQTCDPGDECDRLLECATTDPTHGGLCPISRREYKRDISYLQSGDLDRVRDQLLAVRLATYRYKTDVTATPDHLGFIIDDMGQSPAIAPDGTHVDLYGYASMAVAAIQAQQKEIAELRAKMTALEGKLRVCR